MIHYSLFIIHYLFFIFHFSFFIFHFSFFIFHFSFFIFHFSFFIFDISFLICKDIDGAHTPESAEVCAEWFASSVEKPPPHQHASSTPLPTPPTQQPSPSQPISSSSQQSTSSQPTTAETKEALNVFMFHCGRGRTPATLLKPITSHPRLTNAFELAIFPTFAIFPNTAATLTKILYNDNDPTWQKRILGSSVVFDKIGVRLTLEVAGSIPTRSFFFKII